MIATTARQQAVLDYIVQCIEVEHRFPSYTDIAEDFGFASATAASDHVARLEKKGHLTRSAKGRLILAGFDVRALSHSVYGRVFTSVCVINNDSSNAIDVGAQ